MTIRAQMKCEQCGTATLHTQDPDTVNHVLHLLISVLLVGFWIPVWIAIALSAPRRYMRCSLCGYSDAAVTQDQVLTAQRESVELYRQYEESRRAAGAKARADWIRYIFGGIGRGFFAACGAIAAAFAYVTASIDSALQRATGDDAFMLWMLRAMVVLVVIGLGGAACYAARVAGLV